MTQMAASGGVSMPVSITGRSKPSSIVDDLGLISTPPSSTPRMIDPTVVPSIQPLAMTSCCGGRSSVRIPYFAGEYAAAPKPDDRVGKQRVHGEQHHEAADHLDALVISMTLPFGIESANAPTSGASTT